MSRCVPVQLYVVLEHDQDPDGAAITHSTFKFVIGLISTKKVTSIHFLENWLIQLTVVEELKCNRTAAAVISIALGFVPGAFLSEKGKMPSTPRKETLPLMPT